MPSCKQKTIIKSFRLRIQNKFRNIAEETENVTSLLQSCVTRFDDRVKQLLQIDDENFLTLYEKLNHDFESYQETLCFTQTSIESLIEGEADESEIIPETDEKDVNRYATEDGSLQHLTNPIPRNLCPTDNSSVVYENLLLPLTCENTQSLDIWCKQNSLSSTNKSDQLLDVQCNQSKDESLHVQTFSSNSAFTGSYCSVSLSNKNLASKNDQPLDVQCNQSKDESQVNLHAQTFSSSSSFTDNYCSVSLSNKNLASKNDQPLDVRRNRTKDESQDNLYAQTFSSNSAFTDSYCSVSFSNKNLVYPNEALQKHSPPSLTTESFKSLSQGSCYRSLSSNFSDLDNLMDSTSITETDLKQNVNLLENESHLQSSLHTKDVCVELSIPSLSISVPSNISATLTYVIDPGNFWMQLENSHSFEFDFPVSKYIREKHPKSARKGSFYLAPFKMTSFYYRAEALNSANSEDEDVKVFFIDHGSTQNVLVQDLRLLPWPAYDIPKQAIHCYLYGISPIKLFWPSESIQKMKEFQNFFIETIVKLRNGDKYGVQLTAKVEAGIDEEYSADIAQLLCLDGLAIQNEQILESNQVAKCNKVEDQASREDTNFHSNDATFCSTDNRISCDSGVSVTSIHRHSSISADVDFSCDSLNNCSNSHPSVLLPTSIKEAEVNQKNQVYSLMQSDQCQTIDLISFESIEKRLDGSLSKSESSNSITVDNSTLNITIPFPSLTFVEKGMLLVMLSDIVTPSEFYVNMAMEDIINLDDLREQMTTTYSSEIHSSLAPEDLRENMFCAAHFDKDMNWYRVKILSILSVTGGIALIQYVDYGNKAIMKCQSLRPLKPEFAKHPSFAIKCSLAGVTPPNTKDIQSAGSWNEAAVNEFKKLTSSERCLTAQICEEVFNLESVPLQILLWDTEGTEDLLINSALAVSGVAEFDSSILSRIFPEIKSKEGISDLDYWDPLSEEYNDIENSYGVDMDDLEVAISGQKFNDDSYTCKYFSLRGHCPRGNNCPYLHV
ncbi:Tudor and KH domain-containing protein, partial [Stegodyphus mimosarum]